LGFVSALRAFSDVWEDFGGLEEPQWRDSIMSVATEHLYVVTNEQILSGEPIIKGTRTPVRAIVETWRLGMSPEEIPKHLPHLTLAQVFDALSYYSDHQDEINAHIERNRIPDDLISPLVKDLA
jgi:uncharacterized protein (DUF433 family)